jgi:hypothetical protein
MRKIAPFIVAYMCVLGCAFAHDHEHPELDPWYKSLTNQNGGSCCDGSDAYSVLDPDWEPTADPKKPYRVKVDSYPDWVYVDASSVVKQTNKIGIAKVWPVYVDGKPMVRCFMPGSGA